jgi:hypothetical protein
MLFHDLKANFFLAETNIPLSGCTIVYFFIHLLKETLVASKFWQTQIAMLEISVCRLWCGHKFSTHLGKCQAIQLLDHW